MVAKLQTAPVCMGAVGRYINLGFQPFRRFFQDTSRRCDDLCEPQLQGRAL